LSPIFVGSTSTAERFSTPGLAYRAPLLSGEAGTKQTIQVMRKLVDQAVSDPSFIRFASDIVRSVPAFNDLAEASALYEWVKRNIRYTKDPVTKEKLYPPQELLKIRAGDCDDISMLLGALGIAIGYPARLATISADPTQPNEFSHVYVELEVPPGSGYWLPLDAARLDSQFGVEPPMYFRKRVWSLTDNSFQDLRGLGCECGGQCGSRGMRGLAGVATIGLGDDSVDWSSIIDTTIQQTPGLIAAASGQPFKIQNAQGVVATGPYSSFATPYTPGYGLPPAGYTSAVGLSTSGSWLPWLLIGGVVLLAMGRKS
jgi:hypothetical protein